MSRAGADPGEASLAGVAGVVLAAGGGSRFEAPDRELPVHKLLWPFRGRPLVRWAVDAALGAGFEAVVVVTGAVDLSGALPAGAIVVENPRWAEGQASSLQVALDWCRRAGHRAAAVGLGDQPLIPSSAWEAVGRCEQAPVVAATYGGRRRNPVRLDRSVWHLLPASGDEGARALMRRRPDLVAETPCEGDPADVDTLEDLRRWS